MIDLTAIIEAVATLIAVVVTAVVIPLIKSKTTATQQAQINAWVKIAVSAAEQIFPDFGQGTKKKEYVLAFLKSHGFTVDVDAIDAIIESAVFELNSGIIPLFGGDDNE